MIQPVSHHEILGHVPTPGFSGIGSGNVQVAIDADGLRSNGEVAGGDGPPILAVGDSYTYGEEVGDRDTWPAQVQALSGRRVLNGGVSGYGFDQIVLRAEQLVARYAPSIVVVSFIADDIRRLEMRRLWWRDKPWFDLEGEDIVLRGTPVPRRERLSVRRRHEIERILIGLSPLVQSIAGYTRRVHPVGTGLSIAERLVGRLAVLQRTSGARILVLAQYHLVAFLHRQESRQHLDVSRTILRHAAAHGLATLDTHARLAAEPDPARFYAASHMNARGNRVIAGLVGAQLPKLTS